MADPSQSLRDGRYAVIRVLAQGGQATTLEAVDKQRGAPVVVKRFTVRGASSWKEVELAEREADVLASIQHPSIPRYVEHFEENGELYLVTERIEGNSLAELVKRRTRFSEADVVAFLKGASEALDYLHGRAPPIVHRDIKPSNVIRRPDGSFALIDFGSVRDRMKPEGGSTVVGTFGYMAPEQFQGRAMPASDVYAVGATALVLLTGTEPEKLPHKGLAIDVEGALRGTQVRPALVRVLAAMLEPDPDKRAGRIAPLLSGLGGERPSKRPGETGSGSGSGSGSGDWRGETKRERRERRREEHAHRREQRAERRARRALTRFGERGPGRMPWLLLLAFEIAFQVAEMLVMLALGVVVPLFLHVLSLLFGKKLRDAARSVSDTRPIVRDWFRSTRQELRGGAPQLPAAPQDRARIAGQSDASGRVRVNADTPEADAEAAEDEASAHEPPARKGTTRT